MPRLLVLTTTVFAILGCALANNRAAVCQKAVNLGVTFYTAKEMEPILACADTHFYNDPKDPELVSKAKTCVINNSMNKAIAAMNLYSGFNGCTNLSDLVSKLATPFINLCKPVINKALSTLDTCKANNKQTGNAKQTACMNKVYTNCIAMVTKQFVNKVCTGLAKKMNAKEWNCCKTYVPKVADAKAYKCYSIEK
ncbi:DUF19 domain-containing protein [Caenorhabditis elegans]|uniref:DUF19 domain-containing protein n=1 Tax=Caenorhabditis elegans TaxID=6239 RepID=O16945_CAEEL|nr:DUF19 domain-containing protein [Caenorhabditis elegans]CCD71079.1 DUF19 domain-containing protein [Caenorhabditis elegans]|eukprot:NP_503343.4 Uncharacterized protein CELE_K09C6.9 [Caenorhabditis elegans]